MVKRFTYQEGKLINWFEAAERCKNRLKIKSDFEFASLMGVTRSHLSGWRHGKHDLGLATKIRMLDLLGFEAARAMIYLVYPENIALEIIQTHDDALAESRVER